MLFAIKYTKNLKLCLRFLHKPLPAFGAGYLEFAFAPWDTQTVSAAVAFYELVGFALPEYVPSITYFCSDGPPVSDEFIVFGAAASDVAG